MIEYSECEWCDGRIWQDSEDPEWVHRSSGQRFCQVTVATPPSDYGRCKECNEPDWRTCGCLHIVPLRPFLDSRLDLLNEEKQSGR